MRLVLTKGSSGDVQLLSSRHGHVDKQLLEMLHQACAGDVELLGKLPQLL